MLALSAAEKQAGLRIGKPAFFFAAVFRQVENGQLAMYN
jgi:hypothetical protein